MESDGASSFLRNRKSESFFSAPKSMDGKNETECDARNIPYVDEGWISVLISWVRIVICFVSMMFTTFIWALIMVVLIPWPCQRIKQGNVYGHITGRMLMWILGNPIKIEAKKEIIWYPLFGQLYVLAGHLRIDRTNPSAALESMKKAARAVVENNLSLIIFPEGTRSRNGRLLPFKKGFVHLALQTRRPIVPVVLTGTHMAWRKGSLRVRPAPLTVKFLSPIQTDDWTFDRINDHVRMIHDMYIKHLPESQRPLPPGVESFRSNPSS